MPVESAETLLLRCDLFDGFTKITDILAELREGAGRTISAPPKPITILCVDARFQLVTEFEITVPDNYDHASHLDTFKLAHKILFCDYHPALTSVNFAKATAKLTPGRRLKVQVFQIRETMSSEDCLAFLKSQKAILTGAHGAALVWEQARNELPKGRWHFSFDEEDALPLLGGCHGVPRVFAGSVGGFWFNLSDFEVSWRGDSCLLCFRD